MKNPLSAQRVHALALAAALTLAGGLAQAQVAKPYFEFRKPATTLIPGDISLDTNGAALPVFNAGSPYVLGFEGISQYDGASFGRNFIPPDTMGAAGRTQYVETSNGAYAIFDKNNGNRLSLVSDVAFWAAAGQTGTNGDSRIMYNAAASRWIAVAFGANAKDLQIAVSDTDNALGTWKSTKFEGYAGLGFGATADYPTLALDRNAVYIGTNNFAPATSGGTNSFRGTTLNVIPLESLFNAGAPTTANFKQFITPYSATSTTNIDRGFAMQGVNSNSAGSTGKVVGASLFIGDNVAYTVNGLSTSSATGSTLGAVTFNGQSAFNTPGAGRQPSVALPANQRIISTLDERVSSSAYEVNGRIYVVNTVDPANDGRDETRMRYSVLDANTFALIAEGDIGEAGYDYYQGSIAVNSQGVVVLGYNRSGLDPATGKISFMARVFNTAANGSLVQVGDEMLLKESLVDDYHNGSIFGQASVGRQRWGDYSQVSVDPTDEDQFYLVGQFAREYNLPEFGHPGGTGGSRWGTWIAMVDVSVIPEPSTYLLMLLGAGAVFGAASRRRRESAA
jgi:hypothetical protein